MPYFEYMLYKPADTLKIFKFAFESYAKYFSLPEGEI